MNAARRQPMLVVVDEPVESWRGQARGRCTGRRARVQRDHLRQSRALATEVATNLAKHSKDGVLILQCYPSPESAVGLEILALYSGPGMVDLIQCMSDGYSTVGTPGNGLGAIKRVADSFDIYSRLESGTALLGTSRIPHTAPCAGSKPAQLKIGAVSLPVSGEQVCGDAWAMLERDDYAFLLVVDGLGHGPAAAEAAALATRVFQAHRAVEPEAIIQAVSLRAAKHAGGGRRCGEIRLLPRPAAPRRSGEYLGGSREYGRWSEHQPLVA